MNFRWSSESSYSSNEASIGKNNPSPVITVEGRGKGFAVVQMKNTFYITDNNVLQSMIFESDQNNKWQSQASHEAFNLDTSIELLDSPKGVPPTRLRVETCQR